ncbi:MAG: hypothetical protein RJB11_219 [Planctomycetota bacterium]
MNFTSVFHGSPAALKTEQPCEFRTPPPSSRSPQRDHIAQDPLANPSGSLRFYPINSMGLRASQLLSRPNLGTRLVTFTRPKGSIWGKRLKSGPKARNHGTHPQTGPEPFHPVKTWRFAILPSMEVLVEMAYGSGMKKQASASRGGRRVRAAVGVTIPTTANSINHIHYPIRADHQADRGTYLGAVNVVHRSLVRCAVLCPCGGLREDEHGTAVRL